MDGPHPPADVGDPTFQNTIFEILSNPARRSLLQHLTRNPGPIPVDKLATAVAARTLEIPRSDVTAEQRARTLVSLQHTHLPKLRDLGIVTWTDGEVTLNSWVSQLSITTPTTGDISQITFSRRETSD